jgi:hypothetical protein
VAGSRRLDPAAVAALLRRRWAGGHRRWLDGAGSWPLAILLHPPTERETTQDLAGVRGWVERWAAVEADPGRPGELVWTERQWPGLGRQRLPERLVLAGAAEVAAWTGARERWARACERGQTVRLLLARDDRHDDGQPPARGVVARPGEPGVPRAPGSDAPAWEQGRTLRVPEPRRPSAETVVRAEIEALRAGGGFEADPDPDSPDRALRLGRHFDWLADAPAADVERLLAVLRWLIDHPDSGLYVRQLPIPGIDTKWIGGNRGRLLDLLGQYRQREAGGEGAPDTDLHRLAGLRREPDLLRLRLLDPALRAAVGGLGDLTAPVEQIAALPLEPARVFIVENLQTGLAFADLPGAVCCMARGYAVDAYAAIPWLRCRPCHYWGDLDTHGFAILNSLRQHLPDARSLLMDADTLRRHRELWQREDKPAAGPLERLTLEEQAVFGGLLTDRWGERVRLEQERIDWRYAWRQVCAEHRRRP